MTYIPVLFHIFVLVISSICPSSLYNFAPILVLTGWVDGWIDVCMPQILIFFSSHPDTGGNRFLDRIIALLSANGRIAHIHSMMMIRFICYCHIQVLFVDFNANNAENLHLETVKN